MLPSQLEDQSSILSVLACAYQSHGRARNKQLFLTVAEAEMISLDMGIGLQGIPALSLQEDILNLMTRTPGAERRTPQKPYGTYEICQLVDYVHSDLPRPTYLASLVVLEDNDAFIKALIKGRTNNMRHAPRTHRTDLDWLINIMRDDPSIKTRYIKTESHVADIFTEGMLSSHLWTDPTMLARIFPSRLSNQVKGGNDTKSEFATNSGSQLVDVVQPHRIVSGIFS
jgi:hypothetical protein